MKEWNMQEGAHTPLFGLFPTNFTWFFMFYEYFYIAAL